jgi:hypothetical protein
MPSQFEEKRYKVDSQAAYDRLCAGDLSASNDLIELNIEHVHDRVHAYLKRNEDRHHLEDELVAAGLLALTEKCRRFADRPATDPPIKNIVGYICRTLNDAIRAEAMSDTIVIPRQSRHKAAAKGRPISLRRAPTLHDRHAAPDYNAAADLMLELIDYCRNDAEVEIVKLRAAGETLKDISEAVDRPYSFVRNALKYVEEQYDKAREEDDEEGAKK